MVSQSVYLDTKRPERGDKLDGRVMEFLHAANYVLIPVTNFHVFQDESGWNTCSLIKFLEHVDADGVLLTGGNDLGVYENRDVTEETLLAWSVKKNLPALGLCRGMQLMGSLGGAFLEEVTNHIKKYHKIDGQILDNVNSYHRFAFKALPSNYKILAKTSDGVIEAFRHAINNWEGWMWHPEREEKFRLVDIQRTQELFR